MNTDRIVRLSYYGVFLVVLVIALVTLLNGGSTENPIPMEDRVNTLLRMAYVLGYIVVAVALGAFVYNIVRNFKESKGLVIGVVVLALVFVIAYTMAVPDLLEAITKGERAATSADEMLSKMTGAGLITTMIVGALTILSALVFSFRNIFN